MVINYENGSVFQRFPTNITQLSLSPDLNFAFDLKRTKRDCIKIQIMKLWSKKMVLTHLMGHARVPQRYGGGIVRRVLELLDDL